MEFDAVLLHGAPRASRAAIGANVRPKLTLMSALPPVSTADECINEGGRSQRVVATRLGERGLDRKLREGQPQPVSLILQTLKPGK